MINLHTNYSSDNPRLHQLIWEARAGDHITTLSWMPDRYQGLARTTRFMGSSDPEHCQVGLAALVAEF